MSAPMPPELSQQGAPGQVIYRRKPTLDELMTPRRLHIPTFYQGHADLDAFVLKADGTPLRAPFDGEPVRIGEVPVERRWVLGNYNRQENRLVPGNRLLPKVDYVELYQRWRLEFYDLVSEKRQIDNIKFEGRIEAEPIPGIHDFVLMQVNPQDDSKVMEMHYSNRTAGAVPKVLMDSKGEQGKSRDEALREAYRENPDMLTEKERDYVERALLGQDDPMVKLSKLSRQLMAGEITPDQYREQTLAVAEGANVPHVGTTPRGRVEMACGKKVWPSQQESHFEACEECGGSRAA